MGALVAGAKFRGEFEERLKSVLNEVTANQDTIVLFIDLAQVNPKEAWTPRTFSSRCWREVS